MTIWNVSPIYYGGNDVRYSVLPYNLKGVIVSYLKYDKVTRLFEFLNLTPLLISSPSSIHKLLNMVAYYYELHLHPLRMYYQYYLMNLIEYQGRCPSMNLSIFL